MKKGKIMSWLSVLLVLTSNLIAPVFTLADEVSSGIVKVSYNPNGQINSGDLINDQLATGSNYTVRSVGTGSGEMNFTPTAANSSKLIFDSWNTKPNGSGDSYTGGQSVSAWSYTSDTILYAQWASAATLSFSLNGTTGNTAPSSSFQKVGSELTVPAVPSGLVTTKANSHVDTVWNTAADGSGTDYAEGSKLTLTGDTTLYAKVVENAAEESPTVSFDLNSGTTTSTDLINGVKGVSGSVTLPTDVPTRTGYNFTGWKINNTTYQAGDTVALKYSTTAVAQWSQIYYTSIKFTSDGTVSNLPAGDQVASDGSTWTVPSQVPTRAGYTFKNWSYTNNNKAATCNPGDVLKLNTTTTTWTFKAVWTEDNPLLSFNLSGGTASSTDFTSGITATDGSVTLPSEVPVRVDYKFAGWKIGSTTYQAGAKVAVTSSTTAVAQWTAIPYTTVNFKSDGTVSNLPETLKVVSDGTTLIVPSTIPTRASDADGTTYSFMYWIDSAAASNTYSPGDKLTLGTVNKTYTLIAVWAKSTNTQKIVTFNGNGNTSGNPTNTSLGVDPGSTITVPGAGTMKRTNFTFVGWSPDEGETIYAEGDQLTVNEDLTLAAVWLSTSTEGVIKFETQGSSGSDPTMLKATTGKSVTLPDAMEDAVAPSEGYHFWGWAKKSDATYPDYYPGQSISMPKGITTLYGVWSRTSYRYWAEVDISLNKGTGDLPDGYEAVNTFQLESADATKDFIAPSASGITREGYTFGGWKGSDGKTYQAGDTISLTNELILSLTAVWNPITYAVSYDPGDATGGTVPTTATTTVNYKGSYTFLNNSGGLVREGYTFIGWTVDGTLYAPGQKIVVTGDMVITPAWQRNPSGGGGSGATTKKATIVYRATDDNVTGDLPAAETIALDYSTYYTVKDAEANFKRTGYTFVGWYTIDGSGNKVTYSPGTSFIVTNSMVFYALWEAESVQPDNTYKISYNGNGNTAGLVPSNQFVTKGDALSLPTQNTLEKILPIDINTSTGVIDTSTEYLFVGWSTDKDAKISDSSVIPAGTSVTPAADTVYYAIWDVKLRDVSLTYDGNGNTGGSLPENQTEPRGTEVKVDTGDTGATLTKAVGGVTYVFAGWNTQANGKGTDYARGALIALTKDITLYAKWVPVIGDKVTRIIYIGNGNDIGDYVTYDDTSAATYTIGGVGNRKKTGYLFTGWNTKADGSGTSYSPNDVIKTADQSSIVLYAQWDLEARKVTLTYDGNGNTGGTLPSSQTEDRYSKITVDADNIGKTLTKSVLNTNTSTYDTYIFAGWNTKADGSGTNYTSGSSYTLNGDTTLYAKWISTAGEQKMRITYLGNGNDSGSEITTVDTNEDTYTIADIGNRGRTNYIFTHWNTKADGTGTSYYAGQVIDTSINASLILYAQWSPVNSQGITITYDGNNNTSGTAPESVNTTSGTSLTLASQGNLTRTGYSFSGWAETPNPTSGAVVYADGGSAAFSKNTVLYAAWSVDGNYVATPATVNYYANYTSDDTTSPYIVKGAVDANQEVDNKTVLTGHKIVADEKNGGAYLGEPLQFVTAATAGFNKDNYIFKGWSTSPTSTEVAYAPGESLVLSSTQMNLYGVWEVGTYTVSFDANEGTGSMADQTFTYDQSDKLSANGFARTGYTFNGWNTKADGSGTAYANEESVKNLANANQNIKLYAQWKANDYTVAFDKNQGSGTMANQTFTYNQEQNLTKNNFTRSGYSFNGWNTNADGTGTAYANEVGVKNLTNEAAATVTLYAQWSAEDNEITFDANGGTTTQTTITGKTDATIDLSKVVEATRTGYTFLGWYNGEEKIPASVTMPAGGLQYTAKWQADDYTVAFDANNGSGTMANQTFTYDQEQNLTKNSFSRTGYTFNGWNTKADGSGTAYEDEAAVSNLTAESGATVTLYAQWLAGENAITFDANGGTTDQTAITGKTDATIDLSKVVEATRAGYTFLGWYNGEEKIPASVTMPAGGLQYTAKWQANNYVVAFDANNGTGTMDNQAFTYDAAQKLTSNSFTRNGYSFTGWNTKADGTGTAYADQAEVKNLTTASGATVTLYAQWSAGENTITFDANGGTTDQTAITGKTDATIDLSKVVEATRAGYTFLGWYNGEKKIPASVTMPAGGLQYTAKWQANDYIVAFDGNTGKGTMANQTFTYDQEQSLTENSFTKSGYTFVGWNTEKDGTGTSYANSAKVKNLTTTAKQTVTLYAQWSAGENAITFDANGGTTDQTAITGKTDATIDLSKVVEATRTGYTFLGWYNGEEKIPASVTMPAGGLQYTAKWQANDYVVAFDANNGSGTMNNQAFTYDEAQKLTVNSFARTGYSFTGWNTKADGTGTVYADQAEVKNLTTEVGTVVTLYAQWSAEDNTITFDANGGTTDQTAITGKTDATIDLSKVVEATRAGYTFLGWYNGEEKIPASVAMPAGGLQYTAKWQANDYVVAFDANNGSGKMHNQAFTYDETQNLTANSFARTGYTFVGWNTKADGTGTAYADQAEVKNLITASGATVTLYAQWLAQDNDITFDPNGGVTTQTTITGKTDATIDLSKVVEATRAGYTFLGWYNGDEKMPASITMPAGGTHYTARWQANQYSVIFDANQGSGTMANQTFIYDQPKSLTKNTFTRNGYRFTGWNTQADGSGTSYGDEETVSNLATGLASVLNVRTYSMLLAESGSITLYAQWSAEDNDITFDANGGTTEQSTITGKTDATIDLSKVVGATRTGYTFLGWYNGEEKISASVTMPAGGLQYTAKWQANDYVVAFDANQGSGTMDNQTFTYDEAQNLTVNSFTRTGYRFTGWNTEADGTGAAYADQAEVKNLTAEADATVTLYAQWKQNGYTVKFDPNSLNTEGTMNDQDFTYDEAQKLAANDFSRVGYSFNGWNTKADGSGKAYKDAETVLNLASQNDAVVTLYAQWSADQQTIKFDANGGTTTQKAIVGDTDEKIDLTTVAEATRKGYTFVGWYTELEAGTKMPNTVTMPVGGTTYYAHWKKTAVTTKDNTKGTTKNDPATTKGQTSKKQNSLPKTNDHTSYYLVFFGFVLIASALYLRFRKRN